MKKIPLYWRKLLGYSLIGGSTMAIDLGLYAYLKANEVHYLSAAAIAFLFAVTLNYIISRSWVFHESDRHFGTGYLLFIAVAITGAGITVILLAGAVEILRMDQFIGRLVVGAIVGLLNFTFNYYFNFRMENIRKEPT